MDHVPHLSHLTPDGFILSDGDLAAGVKISHLPERAIFAALSAKDST